MTHARIPTAALVVLSLVLGLFVEPAQAFDSDAPEVAEVLRDLGSEAEVVRNRALRRLERAADVDADLVTRGLETGSPRAQRALLELVATRELPEFADAAAKLAAADDPELAETALRTLVALGDDAVQAGLRVLGELGAPPEHRARHRRLRVVAIQRAVEARLMSHWQLKGGSYDGRFADLGDFGRPVQTILLAMLLDVPLEDRFVVLADDVGADERPLAEVRAVIGILESTRRGYRTFRPLRSEMHPDDLFELAGQALMDVGDAELLGDPLERLARTLQRADDLADFRLRPVERYYAEAIEEVLARLGRPDLLTMRVEGFKREAASTKRFIDRRPPERRAEVMNWYVTDLVRLAGAQHRLRQFEEAAATYAEAIELSIEIGGSPPAISCYNRACALARAGRKDEALDQLDISLGADTGGDLSRQWVNEDGDLRSLHDDPRFAEIVEKHFGKR